MDHLPPYLTAQAEFLARHAIPADDVQGSSATRRTNGDGWLILVRLLPTSTALRALVSTSTDATCTDGYLSRRWMATVDGGYLYWETPNTNAGPVGVTVADALAALPVAP